MEMKGIKPQTSLNATTVTDGKKIKGHNNQSYWSLESIISNQPPDKTIWVSHGLIAYLSTIVLIFV